MTFKIPEPVAVSDGNDVEWIKSTFNRSDWNMYLYTADALRYVLEAAALVCEAETKSQWVSIEAAAQCAQAIRAMKEST